ncbi:MAG: VCBS repeat-containing protein [Bacteroidota bacterium]
MRNCYPLLLISLISFFVFSCTSENENVSSDPASSTPATKTVTDPQFQLLTAEQTGIQFSNTISESFKENILNYSYLYNGGGVAIIDVNNDGLQDIYFTATQEPNRLFLNKGNWKFEDITQKAGVGAVGGKKTGVTVVDINEDGFFDLYVCRSGAVPGPDRSNLLYLNNGNLTFTESARSFGLDDQSASNHANFFDFDLDGDLDVYLLNHPVDFGNVNKINVKNLPDGGSEVNTEPSNEWDSDKFYRNDGNGKFTNISKQAGIHNRAWGLSATVSDFNRDGYPDIFVGNDYIVPDYLYINNRNGTFSIQTDQYFRHQSNHTMGVDIADFNNDGLVDLVALDMIAEDNQRQKELMTTMMLDRYTNLVNYGYGHQLMRNVLQLNTGRSGKEGDVFSEIGVMSGVWNTDWSWSPLLADFDNDGFKDLYITNGYRRDVSNLDYLTYTSPSLAPGGRIDFNKTPTIQDYLKHVPSIPLENYAFKNVDGLNFEKVNNQWGMTQPGFSNGSAYADMDNDGDLDLLVNNIASDIMVYQNQTVEKGGSNWFQVELKGNAKNPSGIGTKARISVDGKIQYQEMTHNRGFLSCSQPLFHFGLGKANSIEKLELQWSNGQIQILENLPVNQKVVLNIEDAGNGKWEETVATKSFVKVKNIGLDYTHVEDEFEDFNRERLLPHRFSNLGPSIAVGDANGDGLEDVFIGGARNQAGELFLQNKKSQFSKSTGQGWDSDSAFEDMGSAFLDADNDGDLDLFVASGGSTYEANSANYQDRLYLNNGAGKFTRATANLPNGTASASCVTTFDFDKDGDEDVLVGGLVTPGLYPTTPATCFLVNDQGKFTDYCGQIAAELQQLGMINDLIWADLDGDGTEEIIAAGEWLPISIFKNNSGQFSNATAAFGLDKTNGWWNCLHAVDLDADGDLDLIGGNLGLNSRLKATEDAPLKLFAKDFDKNGSIDPVLAYYNNGKLYPLPLRDMMIKQMPILKKKFVFYKDYGVATITDVFAKNELDAAMQFEAYTFASSWFENKDGRFIQHQLPVEAQFAPVNEIEIHDFNQDNNLDIMLVGNSSSPDVETGRYDAGNGTILLGQGNGKFTALPNRESGFWATREARDLAKVKLANGKTLFIVANNNDRLETYVLN